jgi:hypothetical protein
LCSKSRNSTVSITGVLQDLVAVYELGINPVSGILLGSVVNVVLAEIPLRWFRLDVKLLLNQGVVKVVEDGATKNAGRNFL